MSIEQAPKKLGRPPVKKGKSSWQPASLNEFEGKEEGFRYRMVNKDPKNMAKKAAEGWEIPSSIQGQNTKHVEPGRVEDGKNLTSVQEGHDWVLMRMPEEKALERDAYYNNETKRRTESLTAHIKKEVGKAGGEIHGEITISSRRGEQIIE